MNGNRDRVHSRSSLIKKKKEVVTKGRDSLGAYINCVVDTVTPMHIFKRGPGGSQSWLSYGPSDAWLVVYLLKTEHPQGYMGWSILYRKSETEWSVASHSGDALWLDERFEITWGFGDISFSHLKLKKGESWRNVGNETEAQKEKWWGRCPGDFRNA